MHTIRLRRPWDKTEIGCEESVRVDVPEPIVQSEPAGPAYQYLRRFNLPTGLDDASTVRLQVSGWSGELDAFELNGVALPIDSQQTDIDVTKLLMRQNKIEIRLSSTDQALAALSGEVALLIEEGEARS
jgi:hypothetical protein